MPSGRPVCTTNNYFTSRHTLSMRTWRISAFFACAKRCCLAPRGLRLRRARSLDVIGRAAPAVSRVHRCCTRRSRGSLTPHRSAWGLGGRLAGIPRAAPCPLEGGGDITTGIRIPCRRRGIRECLVAASHATTSSAHAGAAHVRSRGGRETGRGLSGVVWAPESAGWSVLRPHLSAG